MDLTPFIELDKIVFFLIISETYLRYEVRRIRFHNLSKLDQNVSIPTSFVHGGPDDFGKKKYFASSPVRRVEGILGRLPSV